MRTVFATQFGLRAHDRRGGDEVFLDVQSRLETWVKEKYVRVWSKDVSVTFDGNTMCPVDGHELRGQHQSVDNCDLLMLEWVHPHDKDPSSQWVTSFVAGRHGNDVDVALVIRIATTQMTLRPVEFELGRPRLINDMLSAYETSMNGWRIPIAVEKIPAPDVESYVQQILLSPARSLPVLMVSPDAWSDTPIVPADRLFSALRGFCHVAVLGSKWAAFKLTDVVGKGLTCYNGAVRVYWPGLTLDADPLQNWLYMPGAIRQHEEDGTPIEKHLFRALAGISSFRFVEGPAVRSARKALGDVERARLLKLASEVKEGKTSSDELQRQLLDSMLQVEELTRDRDRLIAELDAQKANWAEMASYAGLGHQTARSENGENTDGGMKTVKDAVEKAKADFPGCFEFLKKAEALAEESPFSNTEAVEGLFQALAELVVKWQKGEALGGTWKECLSQKGFDYKPDISQLCKQKKFIGEYQGSYNGTTLTFGEHVTFGKGQDPQKCMSVHWWRNETKKILVIGRCGKHGTNSMT